MGPIASTNDHTHRANALIPGAGHDKVADFMRVGGLVTMLYLALMLAPLNRLL